MDEQAQTSEAAPSAVVAESTELGAPAPEAQLQAPQKQVTLWDKLTTNPEAEAAPVVEEANPVEEAPRPVVEKKPRQARKLADMAEREAAAKLSAAEKQELETYRRDIAELKVNPLAVLAKAGVTYENVTLDALKGNAPKAPSPELQAVRAELQREIDSIKSAEFNRQVGAIKQEIRQHIAADPEKYKYTVASGDQDKVWDTMVQIAEQSGGKSTPTYAEAAEFYEAQLKRQADIFMAVNARTAPPAPVKVEAAEKAPAKPTTKPALTNAVGAPAVVSAPSKPKTKDEAFKSFKTLVEKAYRGEGLR
jgi:hypothetical protein